MMRSTTSPISIVVFVTNRVPFLYVTSIGFFRLCRTRGTRRRWGRYVGGRTNSKACSRISNERNGSLRGRSRYHIRPTTSRPRILPRIFLYTYVVSVRIAIHASSKGQLTIRPCDYGPRSRPTKNASRAKGPGPAKL